MMEKPLLVLLFSGRFLLTATPAATKEFNVYFFIDNFTFRNELVPAKPCKLYNRIPGTFQNYYCHSMLQGIHRRIESS